VKEDGNPFVNWRKVKTSQIGWQKMSEWKYHPWNKCLRQPHPMKIFQRHRELNCLIRCVASIPHSDDRNPLDPSLENASQVVSLESSQNLADRFKKTVWVVALELIKPIFDQRK
jgi:hypothetical protein